MRHLLCLIVVLAVYHCAPAMNVSPQDSLLNKLEVISQPLERMYIYRNLSDIYAGTPLEKEYLKHTITEASKTDDKESRLEAMTDLACAYIQDGNMDSTSYYMDTIEKEFEPSEAKSCGLTYLNLRKISWQLKEEKIADDKFKEMLQSENAGNDVYKKIEKTYLLAGRLIVNHRFKEVKPYLDTLIPLARSLPWKYGYTIISMSLWLENYYYLGLRDGKGSIRVVKELLDQCTNYYTTYYKSKRPFFKAGSRYLQYYSSLLINIRDLSEEEALFYLDMAKKYGEHATDAFDRYNYFMAISNYNLSHDNYTKALPINDSLIKYASAVAPYVVPGLYLTSSQMNEELGKYKDALDCLKTYQSLNDSLRFGKISEQLNELQVKYDVDKLTYKNTQLEIKNKRIMLLCVSAGLILAVVICFYLYYIFKKEKRMKEKLYALNLKVEESEKMKTAFIHSICHEIRTPLNAIVGFSDLIFDESLDAETRKDFIGLIRENSTVLTSLIDEMIEVARLDVSEEEFPCEPVNVSLVCRSEMDKLAEADIFSAIECRLDVPEEASIISTNSKYLSFVIGHLLGNALKFTDSGNVTLCYSEDEARRELSLSVSDTGCGIPIESQEAVFDRFVKLDSFKRGNGLGLYLCRLIVERLSGKIYIDPAYVDGTRVVVVLPV